MGDTLRPRTPKLHVTESSRPVYQYQYSVSGAACIAGWGAEEFTVPDTGTYQVPSVRR